MREQPFYIGEKVVAVKSFGRVTKDSEYTIIDIAQCSCGAWHVLVKEIAYSGAPNYPCCTCYKKVNLSAGYSGGPAKFFAPIQENFQAITFEKIMETELTSVN
jgi:hypothetical protein